MPISDRLALDPLASRGTAVERLAAQVSELHEAVNQATNNAPEQRQVFQPQPVTTAFTLPVGSSQDLATFSFLATNESSALQVFLSGRFTTPSTGAGRITATRVDSNGASSFDTRIDTGIQALSSRYWWSCPGQAMGVNSFGAVYGAPVWLPIERTDPVQPDSITVTIGFAPYGSAGSVTVDRVLCWAALVPAGATATG